MNATFVEGVIENANSQQFGMFLPSFVILCIMLAISVPGNTLALLVYWRKLQNGIARGLFIKLCLGDLLSCVFVTPFELVMWIKNLHNNGWRYLQSKLLTDLMLFHYFAVCSAKKQCKLALNTNSATDEFFYVSWIQWHVLFLFELTIGNAQT